MFLLHTFRFAMAANCDCLLFALSLSVALFRFTVPENATDISDSKVTISPELETMNETLREIQEVIDDSGRIAGIVIGSLGFMVILLSVVGFFMYRQYVGRSITSMNFDNPVYRKTTEDQFSLEKNQYQPARSYPSSLEPLTSPGTNEFV